MQQTIFSVLTDEESRDASKIKTNLDQESADAAPWFDKADI